MWRLYSQSVAIVAAVVAHLPADGRGRRSERRIYGTCVLMVLKFKQINNKQTVKQEYYL